MSMTRTAAQTEVANFWTTNMVIQSNAAYRQQAASRGLGLLDTARLMVMGNMAATDSLIATFDAKYFYNLWRPVTAIQRADTDGNALTDPDPTWMPLVMTPNFPEYVAGHGSFVSAQAEVYTQIFGTPNIAIDLDSSATGTTRHYATADDLRIEIVNARTWAGLHLRNSSVLAVGIGQQLVTDAMVNYFAPAPDLSAHVMTSGGIRKFVDTLPGLGAANPNNLGQYIPVAVPDKTTYPGSDYYEIAVVQYSEKMHSDLPPTLLRGYVQLSTGVVPGQNAPLANTLLDGTADPIIGHTGVTPPHYLGPTIVATKDRPVRIKFYNLLPKDVDGNLFLPVDTTVMGAGMGPLMADMMEPDPQNPMSGMIPKPYGSYAENRATLHLHGGISPWISDGTPHQWITPAGDSTAYPQGVSVVPVPDMNDSGDPNDGVMTFYYTNQQSARLMFYHDHAYGITRLNVYAGEAAPYLITDDTEKKLLPASVDNPTGLGLIPGPADTIPLVVQDKTFVPSETQLAVSDETWDMTRWGGVGNLWLPHVYSPAQNPGDSSGVNQFGRWAYGPWFWPPTSNLKYGPIDNAYYDINCNPDTGWCEPPLMPGVPFNSMGMEAFMDTPMVNGTPYPTVTVDPKAYRFRVLNAANDRFFNLSLYKADPLALTEVQLNPAEVLDALADPTVFPTPVAGTEGPSWIQIGTEGGFLPAPVVIPAQPTTWVNDPTVFNAGNVDKHSLLLGPAERADVIVDFSAYAGQTLILYNDAPAAFPARDPRYDYYTGNGDYRATGGAPSTLPGYGPNTRTVMQIKVAAAAPAPAYNLVALETAFKAKSLGGQGVFETSQHPIVVGQGAYNSAYGTTFQSNGPLAGLAQIYDTSLTFKTLLGATLTMPLQPKMIQDEMGEAFERDYGRMSGFLGLETPNAQAGNQNMILYGFGLPPTEVLRGIELPAGVELAPISTTDDGSQIWKITHNGVDTHPVHFHLYDVQLINRVGWDGIIRKPDLNELGWKDTVRVSPLEDTIVALRPLVPRLPWDLPNSVRLIDPTMPENAALTMGMQIFDPSGQPVSITNRLINFGWEYVWHCHILSHEEMDMMRPQSIGVKPRTPANLTATQGGVGVSQVVNLEWADNSLGETSFTVQRAEFAIGPWTDLATLPINTTTYADAVGNVNQEYFYRVFASNTVGDTATYAAPSIGFPNTTMVSEFSNTASITVAIAPPAAPTTLTAVVQAGPRVALGWMDNAVDETGFVLERSVNGGAFVQIAAPGPQINTGNMTYTDAAVTAGNTYAYRVKAVNGALSSAWSNTASVTVTAVPVPAAPSNLTATLQAGPQVQVTWRDNATNETGFVLERSVNAGAFAQIVAPGPRINTGNVTYTDAAVIAGNTYTYRVKAVNGPASSAWSNTATVTVTASLVPAVPSGVLAAAARQGRSTDRITLTWTDNANNETGYTIQRATNAAFTAGRVTSTVGANSTTFAAGSNFRRNRNFYFRIRAFNNAGVSAWVNATPFPVRTP
ncbi:MAG: multicopper oxidase domain-containing protein [Desulfosalsimonadaceae bacterium]